MDVNNKQLLKHQPEIGNQMWNMFLKYGQKPNIPALEENVQLLIKASMQNTAGQRVNDEARGNVNWEELNTICMAIIIEASALVLSGELDKLKSDVELDE